MEQRRKASLISAVEIAKREQVDPRVFRAALRAASLPWHQHKTPWAAIRDGQEHHDMEAVMAAYLRSRFRAG
jgi:hypothetical protein